MNDPLTVLEQARRRRVMAMKRCVCVSALILLFLAALVGGVPNIETGGQESTLQFGGRPALADTLASADQYYDGIISTRARFKAH